MDAETLGASTPIATPAPSWWQRVSAAVPVIATAGCVFWIAYDSGTYSVSSRTQVAIVVWWAIALASLAGIAVLRLTRASTVTLVGLALLAISNVASTAWTPSPGAAFAEYSRVLLYVAVFILISSGARELGRERLMLGLELGIVSVVALALVSRLFPGVAGSTASFRFLPVLGTRLNYPVGYWNGLAILAALALPLLLGSACAELHVALRAVALAPVPAIAGAIYLTSSRGGLVAAALAVLVAVVTTPARARAGAALVVAGAGAATSIITLHASRHIVDHPALSSPAERHHAALTLAIICLGVGVIYAIGDLTLGHLHPSLWLNRSIAAAVLLAVVAAVVAAHPGRRFTEFKSLEMPSTSSPNYVEQHVLSTGGNGRWQLWTAAVNEFRSAPVIGRGAGSYTGWWEQHRSEPLFVRDAHSQYLQTLAELGVIGGVLLAMVLIAPLWAGARRLKADRATAVRTSALLGSFTAFLVGLGVDWIWQLPCVAAAGVAVAALLTAAERRIERRILGSARWLGTTAVVLIAAAAIVSEAIPMVADQRLRASAEAATAGDAGAAASAAQDARAIAPWDAAPYVQLALLAEQAGRYRTADRWIHAAIRRDQADWTLWLVATRVETRAGEVEVARRSLAKARQLNPLGTRQLLPRVQK